MSKRCHCIIHHPLPGTPEHEAVKENLDYFRRIGDTQGMMIALAQPNMTPDKLKDLFSSQGE